jgi:hypothetical protein
MTARACLFGSLRLRRTCPPDHSPFHYSLLTIHLSHPPIHRLPATLSHQLASGRFLGFSAALLDCRTPTRYRYRCHYRP